jgi:hypothetical protein
MSHLHLASQNYQCPPLVPVKSYLYRLAEYCYYQRVLPHFDLKVLRITMCPGEG